MPVTHISRARRETQAVLQIFIFVFYVFLVSIFVHKERFAGLFSSNILNMGAHGNQPGVRLLARDIISCFDSNSCSEVGPWWPSFALQVLPNFRCCSVCTAFMKSYEIIMNQWHQLMSSWSNVIQLPPSRPSLFPSDFRRSCAFWPHFQ